jgi:hypothetical protein
MILDNESKAKVGIIYQGGSYQFEIKDTRESADRKGKEYLVYNKTLSCLGNWVDFRSMRGYTIITESKTLTIQDYKVGDRIELTKEKFSMPPGTKGTVVLIEPEFPHGITCTLEGKPREFHDNNGWFCLLDVIKKIPQETQEYTPEVGDVYLATEIEWEVTKVEDNYVYVDYHLHKTGRIKLDKANFTQSIIKGTRKLVTKAQKKMENQNIHNLEVGDYLGITRIKVITNEGINFDCEGTGRFFTWKSVNENFGQSEGWTLKRKEKKVEQTTGYQPQVGDIYNAGLPDNDWKITDIDDNYVYVLQTKSQRLKGDPISKKGFTESFKDPGNRKLIKKAEVKELIAYELVKDLPGIKAGQKSVAIHKDGATFHYDTLGAGGIIIPTRELQDITWFKPLYKSTEVVVEISEGRKVTIENKLVKFGSGSSLALLGEGMSFDEFKGFRTYIGELNRNTISTARKRYPLVILTFKIGCQEFNKEDITIIDRAITKYEQDNK